MLCGTMAISARSVGICDGVPSTARSSLCIKVIVAKMSGKKMTEGQVSILNQILIISMDR